MPPRIPKACRHRSCAALSIDGSGYCNKHKPKSSWEAYQAERGKSPYNNAKWRKTRESVFRRDKGLCVQCKTKGKISIAQDCDHIINLKQGGSMYDMANLQSLCKKCHRDKTARE